MLRNFQEDIRFCYDIRGKSYDKYDLVGNKIIYFMKLFFLKTILTGIMFTNIIQIVSLIKCLYIDR